MEMLPVSFLLEDCCRLSSVLYPGFTADPNIFFPEKMVKKQSGSFRAFYLSTFY